MISRHEQKRATMQDQTDIGTISAQTIKEVIDASLHTDTALFILSELEVHDLRTIQERLEMSWERVGSSKKSQTVGALTVWEHTLPWSEQPARAFYNSYIEWLDISMLRNLLSVNLSPESSLISSVVKAISFPYHIEQALGGKNPDDLLMAYLTDSCSQSELRKLGIARNLTTEDRYTLLQCILRSQQKLSSGNAIQNHRRIWWFLSEAENVLDYMLKERREFLKGFTSLISSLGSYITVWLNCSDESLTEKVKEACGDNLWAYLDHDFTCSREW